MLFRKYLSFICLAAFFLSYSTASTPAVTTPQATPLTDDATPTQSTTQSLSTYYQLKQKNPAQAKTYLTALLAQQPNNITAQKEMGYLLLNEKNLTAALFHFKMAKNLDPNDYALNLQIGYILNQLGSNQAALAEFSAASASPDAKIQQQARQAISNLSPAPTPAAATAANSAQASKPDLNTYYALKNQNPTQAEEYLAKLLAQDPTNANAQKEMGYLLLNAKKPAAALPYFQIAEKLNPGDYALQLQTGYILNSLGRNKEALSEFSAAAISPDLKIQQQAKQAIANLTPTTPIVTTAPLQATTVPNLDGYYELKKKNPAQAEAYLAQLLVKYPNNATAQKEMGYLLLNAKKPAESLPHFQMAEKLNAADYDLKLQVAYILNGLGRNKEALIAFSAASASPNAKIRQQAKQAIANLTPSHQPAAAPSLLDTYFQLKKTNPAQAQAVLASLLIKEPYNLTAQKEMGYLLLSEKQPAAALPHFQTAEMLDPSDYTLKLQIAYILNGLQQNAAAFAKFAEASKSPDLKTKLIAKQAMANLAGIQTKVFPSPYFADLYFSPFYLPRFKDKIFPLDFRFGRYFGPHQEIQTYGVIHYVQDTNSSVSNQVSQIISDNVVIGSLGIRYTPFYKIPVFAYFEYGEAQNILPNPGLNQGKWQYDMRGGIGGYKNWGARPSYTENWSFSFKQLGDVYGNFSYYSRYQNNWIGQVVVREGLRIAQFRNISIDVYWKANLLFDTLHQFYNNALETGPGIAITPYNLLNMKVRIEFNKGFYIPVASPSPNPYGSSYNANTIMLETYFTF